METEQRDTGQERNQNLNETIAACATPNGTGAIGILKISGPESVKILQRVFRPRTTQVVTEFKNFRLYLGDVINPVNNQIYDEAMAVVMRGPHSYTREDVVEIQYHGGTFLSRKILNLVLNSGAVPAPPGEFTRRAYLNGRIDLTQAEAIVQLIRARSEKALIYSHRILTGELGTIIHQWQDQIVDVQATLQSMIDFLDHEVKRSEILTIAEKLEHIIKSIQEEINKSEKMNIFQNDFRVVITGKPNAGKSSLFNSLLTQERALVSECAGTTRDIVEESIVLEGNVIRFSDTAGIRVSQDSIEKMGMQKTQEYLKKADLILAVIDRSQTWSSEDRAMATMIQNCPKILVLSKSDLKKEVSLETVYEHILTDEIIEVSARTGNGIKELLEIVNRKCNAGQDAEENPLFTTERQKASLEKALQGLNNARRNILDEVFLDMTVFELEQAGRAIGTITGDDVEENVQNALFSNFCIGK